MNQVQSLTKPEIYLQYKFKETLIIFYKSYLPTVLAHYRAEFQGFSMSQKNQGNSVFSEYNNSPALREDKQNILTKCQEKNYSYTYMNILEFARGSSKTGEQRCCLQTDGC